MRAVQVSDPGEVEMVDLPDPLPGPGERLVTVVRAGICGTDRRLVARGSEPPRIPGHEVAGRLEDGTPVGVHPDVGCGQCRHCKSGFENRCPERTSIGLDRDGGLAELVVVPENHLVPLEGMAPELGPLLEPLACCLHAVSLLPVAPGEPALVVGAGSMGILSMWTLRAFGCRVVVCQSSEPRRTMAAKLGADAVVSPEEDPAAALGEVPQVAIVTAPDAGALTWALERVALGGTVHTFAGIRRRGKIDPNLVHYRHLSLVGSTGSRILDYRLARDLVLSGEVDLWQLEGDTVSLEDAPRALQKEPAAQILKVLVEVEEGGKREA